MISLHQLHSGITSHRNSIVQAIAQKVNLMIPGSYDENDYLKE